MYYYLPEELDKVRDGSVADDTLCLVGGSGSDVGQSPSGLELQRGIGVNLEQFDESWNETSLDHAVDGWVALPGTKWHLHIKNSCTFTRAKQQTYYLESIFLAHMVAL